MCSFFVDTKIAEAERKKASTKKDYQECSWSGLGIKIGIECVGKNPNAKRVTLLQLHRTGRTISDNVALRTPDFYARKRAAGVTCRSAGRTGFVFFPKAKNQVSNVCISFWTSLDRFQGGMVFNSNRLLGTSSSVTS